jgi:predicted ATP-grasp superfamily ATP-dependent carboligase
MRVLVTDSDARAALAATRALGRAGHAVFTCGERHPSLASVSRYSQGFDAYPSPARDARDFVVAVAAAAARRDVDVILPITELTTLHLSRFAALLPSRAALPLPSADAVAAAADKGRVLQLAESLGIAIPKTLVVESADRLAALEQWRSFPAVVKCTRSRVPTSAGWVSTRVEYCEDAVALRNCLSRQPDAAFPFLVQERIVGPGVGVFACFANGEPVVWFAHRRLREKPPSGGVSVLCESAIPEPDAVDAAGRLLRALDWRGVAMVEFKRDLASGRLALMEINGRFWGSLQLAIDAGVDFPALAVAVAARRPIAPPPPYRAGVRSRWLWGDLSVLLLLLTRSRRSLNLPAGHPGKLASLLSFLRLWSPGTRYEIERWDDLRPARHETRRELFGGR